MNLTHKQFAQLLRQFADMVENRATIKVAKDETPTSTNNIDDNVNHLPADGKPPEVYYPDVDTLKGMLASAGRKHGTPIIRDLVTDAIGSFKTAAKMSSDERSNVHTALTKLGWE